MKVTVLIIDDSEDDRFFFKKALQTSGIEAFILNAEDGISGCTMATQNTVDCIFLDYNLPGMNGMDVLKKIRIMGIDIPVIMLTGQKNDETIVRLLKEGATDYIPKASMTPDTLRLSIESSRQLYHVRKEKQLAEDALRASEARLREAQTIGRIGNWEYNMNTEQIILSEEARRILKYPPEQNTFSYVSFLRRVHPQDLPKVKSWISNIIKSASSEVSFRMVDTDKKYTYIHIKEHRIKDKPKGIHKTLGTIQDVTTVKNALQDTQKAKIGRKATSIVLITGICIFIVSEAFLDPFVDALNASLLIALSYKGGIALFLKPMETILEKFMISRMVV